MCDDGYFTAGPESTEVLYRFSLRKKLLIKIIHATLCLLHFYTFINLQNTYSHLYSENQQARESDQTRSHLLFTSRDTTNTHIHISALYGIRQRVRIYLLEHFGDDPDRMTGPSNT